MSDPRPDYDNLLAHCKKLEQQLATLKKQSTTQSLQRLQLAVNLANVGLWDWDLGTDKVYYSLEWKKQLGYQDNEIGDTFEEWRTRVHPDDFTPTMNVVNKYLKNPIGRYQVEFRLRHKDGEYIWILAQGAALVNEQGKPERLLGSHLVITQLKRNQAALNESEERFRAVSEFSKNGVLIVDTQSKVTWVNKQITEICGYSSEQILQSPSFTSFLAPESVEAVVINFQKFVRKQPYKHHYLFWFYRADGQKRLAEINKTDFTDRNGQRYLIINLQDITEQQKASHQLTKQVQQYKTIINTTSDGFILVDTNGVITDVNPAYCQLTGYTKQELVGQNVTLIDSIENSKDVAARLDSVRRKSSIRFETTHKAKNGRLLSVEVSSSYWQQGDSIISFVRDITGHKQNQALLEKRMLALTSPLKQDQPVDFADLFNIEDIQKLQDEFTEATGVASLILYPDGTPITKPSNFFRFCDIVRATTKGRLNCKKSDTCIGQPNPNGPIVQPCLSGGLWDAGASITLEGKHVASWLVGQVRNSAQNEQKIREYAHQIDVDENELVKAFKQVPAMSEKQFTKIAQLLYTLTGQLSKLAYQNIQQARFIHERRVAEQELRQSEATLQKVFNLLPVGLWFTDSTGKLIKGNPAGKKIWEIDPEVPLDQYLSKYGQFKVWTLPQHTPVNHKDWAVLKSIEQGITITDQKLEIEDFTGNKKVIVNYTAPLTNDDGKMLGAVVVNQDITQQVKAEETLKQSEQTWRSYVENAPYGVFVADETGKYLQVNPAASAITGYSVDELLEMSIPDILPPNEAIAGLKHFQKLMENGTSYGDLPFMHKSGAVRMWSVAAVKLSDTRYLGFHSDITQRLNSQETIKQLAQMLDMAPNSITVHTLDGKFLYANSKTFTLHGYTAEELMQLNLSQLDAPGSAELIEERMNLIKNTGEARFEVEHKHKSGVIIPLEVYVKKVKWNGTPAMLSIATDLIERQKNQLALKQSEQRYYAFINTHPDIMFVKDAKERYIVANKATLAFFNTTQENILNKTDYQLQNKPGADACHKSDLMALEAGKPITTEEALGDKVYETTKFPLPLIDGSTGIGAIIRDITQRYMSRKKLQSTSSRLQLAVASAHMGVWDLDLKTNQLSWDTGMWKIYGLKPNSVKDLFAYWKSIILPEDFDDAAESLKLAIANQHDYDYEFRVNHPDGSIHYIRSNALVEHNSQGNPVRVTGINRDTTNQHTAKRELEETSTRLELAVKAGQLGVWEWDITTGKLLWNERMWEIYGHKSADNLSSFDVWANTLHPKDKDSALAVVNEAIKKLQDYDDEFRIIRPDGEVRFVKSDGIVVTDSNGTPIKMTGLNRDITERRQAQTDRDKLQYQLAQSQKMESVGRLAGGVAHDFNNMLGVIMCLTDVALDQVDTDSQLQEDLNEIKKASQRSAQLTGQLLAFARKQTISPIVLDLNATVNGMVKMLQRFVGEDVDTVWKPAADLWPIKIDPSQLDQILANLAVNARDAITGIGKFTIETQNVIFDENYCQGHNGFIPGEFVMLAVTDTGSGIDKNTLEHIFEPFFTTKGGKKGSGLGLATVYGIVKQNNGFINVYSEPTLGTTFKIYFPRELNSKAKPVSTISQTNISGSETILLVEDERAILQAAKRILEKNGYKVIATSSPDKALELAAQSQQQFQLLLTDVVMPYMNGRQLRDNLKQKYPDMRTIFMSGYTANVIAHHGVLEDGINYLPKPFTVEQLLARVRQVLDTPSQ